jgi:cytosine/uracil/thiamine/allantoin permease
MYNYTACGYKIEQHVFFLFVCFFVFFFFQILFLEEKVNVSDRLHIVTCWEVCVTGFGLDDSIR